MVLILIPIDIEYKTLYLPPHRNPISIFFYLIISIQAFPICKIQYHIRYYRINETPQPLSSFPEIEYIPKSTLDGVALFCNRILLALVDYYDQIILQPILWCVFH